MLSVHARLLRGCIPGDWQLEVNTNFCPETNASHVSNQRKLQQATSTKQNIAGLELSMWSSQYEGKWYLVQNTDDNIVLAIELFLGNIWVEPTDQSFISNAPNPDLNGETLPFKNEEVEVRWMHYGQTEKQSCKNIVSGHSGTKYAPFTLSHKIYL